jgi:putative Mg2+ transporter-C (MgtC) family protein
MTVAEQLEALGLVAVAMVLGGAVGLERNWAGHAAGTRTNMLVSGAAALVVLLGSSLITDGRSSGDPGRALHAVITGIGFLGAGMIIRQGGEGHARGLTTAASVFLVAAIGAATGMGELLLAVGVTALVLLTLRGVKVLERRYVRSGGADDGETEQRQR